MACLQTDATMVPVGSPLADARATGVGLTGARERAAYADSRFETTGSIRSATTRIQDTRSA